MEHDTERSLAGPVDSAEREALDETMRGLASKLGGTAHGFFIRRARYTGGRSTQLVLFLAEAALDGVVGNPVYDAIRVSVQAVADRLRTRSDRAHGDAEGPIRFDKDDVAVLARAGARLTLNLGEETNLVVEELTQDGDDSAWQAKIRNPEEDESYVVWVSPSEDLMSVWLLVNR